MLCFFKRTAARFIDYLLWGMLTAVVLGDKTGDVYSPSRLFYLSFWLYPFVEAALLRSFATTAGKKMTGVYVFDSEGKKLSFRAALKRSFLVFGAGMGFFLPYVSLIFPAFTLFLIFRRKGVFWDKAAACAVRCVKTSVTDKVLLTGFLSFLAVGYFLTVRLTYLHREPDFAAIEEDVLENYYERIRPRLIGALSPEAVLTPQSAKTAVEELKEIRELLHEQSEKLLLIREVLEKRFDRMTIGELKTIRQQKLNAVLARLDSFLFSERIRVGLFESILAPFESEEKNKHVLAGGKPLFEDEEMNRQYDNYMTQLQTFLSLGAPAND